MRTHRGVLLPRAAREQAIRFRALAKPARAVLLLADIRWDLPPAPAPLSLAALLALGQSAPGLIWLFCFPSGPYVAPRRCALNERCIARGAGMRLLVWASRRALVRHLAGLEPWLTITELEPGEPRLPRRAGDLAEAAT